MWRMMADWNDDQQSDAWQEYPTSLQYIDPCLEYIPECKEILSGIQEVRCSKDESYTELLEFGLESHDDSQPQSGNAIETTPVSLQVIPFATGADDDGKLSLTAEDLQTLLHDLQVSPNLLYTLNEVGEVGVKSQYRSDGRKRRTEIWFTLPFPTYDNTELEFTGIVQTVIWFEYIQDTHHTRFLVLMIPQELLARLRHLEENSRLRIQHGYEIVMFLLTAILQKWSSVVRKIELTSTVFMEYNSQTWEGRTNKQCLDILVIFGDHLRSVENCIAALESLLTVTDFLHVHVGTLSIFQDPYHRNLFEEHHGVQRHKVRLLISKFSEIKEQFQGLKTSAHIHPIIEVGATLAANKQLLESIAAIANAKTHKDVKHDLVTTRTQAVVPMFYLPLIFVSSGLSILSLDGQSLGSFRRRMGLCLAVAGPLVTFTTWLLYQDSAFLGSAFLGSAIRRLFSFHSRSSGVEPEDEPTAETGTRTQEDNPQGGEAGEDR